MYSLLIVDDEPMIRKGLATGFDWASMGFYVQNTCADGEQALLSIEEECPDVLLTDISMPNMSGLELLARLRNDGFMIPTVFLSGYDEFSYAQQAVRLSAVDYLLKPIHEDELRRVMSSILIQLDAKKSLTSNPSAEDSSSISEAAPENDPVDRTDSSLIPLVQSYIEDHCGEDLSLSALGRIFFVSPNYLSGCFSAETGKTLSSFIASVRLQKAKTLLTETQNSISEISSACGYSSPRYFTKVFKHACRLSPNEYRRLAALRQQR